MKPRDKKILDLFRALDKQAQESLLDYASYLAERGSASETDLQEPDVLPRPDEETVIKALQRLSKGYSMLNQASLLHETSGLVTKHILQGRSAKDVIDELETVFERYYQEYLQAWHAENKGGQSSTGNQ
ncbi:MAG: hypothetical protein BMS9Abin15_0954 [Gammaproteobacteria bacterium]|nr:MAG: hypothetical protein BMS9Abin15_0954 [Gammaproteobacteria bacterium]